MKTSKILLIIASIVVVVVLYNFLQYPHKVSVSASNSFYMNEDFDTVRKTIVRTESMSKLTELTGCQIINQKWNAVSFKTDRLSFNSNWIIDVDGVMKVKSNNFRGKIIDLKQTAHITPNVAVMQANMIYCVDELKKFDTLIYVRRWGQKTRVDIKVVTDIEYKSPPIKNLHSKIDREISDEINKVAKETGDAFRVVIRVYKGKNFTFRIPSKNVK